MYTLRHDPETGVYLGVRRTADGAQVPPDVSNVDYQEFLAWNAQQQPPLDLSDLPPLSDAQRRALIAMAAALGVDQLREEVVRLRALVRVVLDEFNVLRDWTVGLKAATAEAGTLAAFKTAVAALVTLNPRTRAQLVQALKDACAIEAKE